MFNLYSEAGFRYLANDLCGSLLVLYRSFSTSLCLKMAPYIYLYITVR